MTRCGDCIRYSECKEYVDENECFPEVGGCEAFKSKDVSCNDCICYDILCSHTLQEDELKICDSFKNKADFVEVVRCSECKHLKIINKNGVYAKCKKTGYRFLLWAEDTGKHFCSFAERKKDAD